MNTYTDASFFCAIYGIQKYLVIVSSVNVPKGLVMNGLKPIFNPDMTFFRVVINKIQNIVSNTIGTSANRNSYHIFIRQSLFITRPERFYVCIRIGKGLEICDKFFRTASLFMKCLALLDLLFYGNMCFLNIRTKAFVDTIRASAHPNTPITIGTGKTGVKRDFVHFIRELFFQIFTKREKPVLYKIWLLLKWQYTLHEINLTR